MENDFEFCARRAAEEFMAAGRANTAAERMTHRQLANKYAEIVRRLMKRGKRRGVAPRLPAQAQTSNR